MFIFILSPIFINNGIITLAPVDTVHGRSVLVAVSPLMPGSA
ncbi:MAG TPA: hypothetical protein PLL99_05905 [Chitinophagales bacterium]|nr:hypothetical protein [Chitinophagales bacterium]